MSTICCLRCGYDLSGLSADCVCPECACPVARSLESRQWLRAADPEWLAGVVRGLRLLMLSQWVVAAWLVYTILAALALAFTAVLFPSSEARALSFVAVGFTVALVVGGLTWIGLSIAGAWLTSAASQPPFGVSTEERWTWRLSAIAAGGELVLQTAGLGQWAGGPAWYPYARLGVGQAILMWSLISLIHGLRSHERMTESMSGSPLASPTRAEKNLAAVVLLMGVSWSLVYRGLPVKGLDLLWMFVTLVCLLPTTRRVWRAVRAEQEAGLATRSREISGARAPTHDDSGGGRRPHE